MRLRFLLCLTLAVGAVVVLSHARVGPVHAQAGPQPAVTGLVSSPEDGFLEGVLVSARRAGSPITITVATDEQGRYRFPQARLEPGQYALRIRAVGYDVEGAGTVNVVAHQTTTADLKLRKTQDLASQLSQRGVDDSVPGTVAKKTFLKPCSHCHTLERIRDRDTTRTRSCR